MIDVLGAVQRWHDDGQRVGLATVVAVERSAPRAPGAIMAVNERGEVAGSVSGGCVEASAVEEARDAIATGTARVVRYGSDDAVGLTCGGTIQLFIERIDDAAFAAPLARALRDGEPVALVTRLNGPNAGAKLLVDRHNASGTLGTPGLDVSATAEARALLTLGAQRIRSVGEDGEPIGLDVQLFIAAYAIKPVLYIFGAIDFSRAMARIGKELGYRIVVVDARAAFATPERIPDADEIVVAWPDEFVSREPIDCRSALVILTHDAKFDVPLLQAALRTDAGYIGIMGSRRTHAARLEELRAAGVTDGQLARISGPIGLDIGARTPEETALSIAAEIVAVREGRTGSRLVRGEAPIHASSTSTT